MANRKKKDEALAVVQAQTEGSGQPAVQSGYSAAGLDSRSEVENALANSSYKPSQTVTDAADALKEWQANRPGDYQSSYQERIDQLLNQLLQRESFQYSYTKDPCLLYTSDAADEEDSVDLGGRRIIKKKK